MRCTYKDPIIYSSAKEKAITYSAGDFFLDILVAISLINAVGHSVYMCRYTRRSMFQPATKIISPCEFVAVYIRQSECCFLGESWIEIVPCELLFVCLLSLNIVPSSLRLFPTKLQFFIKMTPCAKFINSKIAVPFLWYHLFLLTSSTIEGR